MSDPSTITPAVSLASAEARRDAGAEHVPVLDGVRGLAILLVMLMHFTVIKGDNRFDQVWSSICAYGNAGVDLFFVLSGFLITGILLDTKSRPKYFRNFYARRTLRIFPLYYAVVFVCLVVLPRIPHAKAEVFGQIRGDEIWYWTYLSNYIIAWRGVFRHAILDVSWSLAIEEQFYLLWPLVVMLCSRRGLKIVCVALVIGSLMFRWYCVHSNFGWLVPRFFTPGRLDGLAIGALLAIFIREQAGLRRFSSLALPTLLLSVTAYAGVCWMFSDDIFNANTREVIGFSLLALGGGAMIVRCLTAPRSLLAQSLSTRPMRTLGKYAYALYLLNFPIRGLIRNSLYKPEQFLKIGSTAMPGQLIFYALAGGASLAAAWISWNLYEKHFLSLKRYFVSR